MRPTRRGFLTLAACGAMAGWPLRAEGLRETGGLAFGSYWRVLHGDDATGIGLVVERVVAEVDAVFSPYRADSAVSAFNASAPGWEVAMPAEALDLARTACALSARTGGAFDPAVGPVVGRLGFGPIAPGPVGRLADLEIRDGAMRRAGTGLRLDFCGIAKGHALERVAAALEGAGLRDFVLELGGEVACRGRHPEGRSWRIAVETPGGLPLAVVPGRLALATSGLWPQGGEARGRAFGHIVDPGTGRAAAGGVRAATVAAATGAEADALATALCTLGAEAGEVAGGWGVSACLTLAGGARVLTGDFARLVAA